MMMNTPVPYLDVMCFFNVDEQPAKSVWRQTDNFDPSCVTVIEPCEVPAWSRTAA